MWCFYNDDIPIKYIILMFSICIIFFCLLKEGAILLAYLKVSEYIEGWISCFYEFFDKNGIFSSNLNGCKWQVSSLITQEPIKIELPLS